LSKKRFEWDEEKIQYLKEHWNKTSLYKLAPELHTIPETLIAKATELGLPEYKSNRWTNEEVEKLKELAQIIFWKDIAPILGKSKIAIYRKTQKLGIKVLNANDIKSADFWTEEKEKYLLENYDKIGITELGNEIDVPYNQILKKLKELGIEWETRKWKEEEIQILREMAQTCHYTEIAKVLNRSVGSISGKAFDLGIETISDYRKFTDEEKWFIIENWNDMSNNDIARALNCSTGQLSRLKKELNLPSKGQKIKWTDEKIDLFRKLAKTKTIQELAKRFKTTNRAIMTIAYKNNIQMIDSKKEWSEDAKERLIELSKTMTVDEIAHEFNKHSSAIRWQARILGIKLMTNGLKAKLWTEDELAQLRELIPTHTTLEVSKIIGRTEDSIVTKAKKLGLKVKTQRNWWTDEEVAKLQELAQTLTVEQIQQEINRPGNSIRAKAKELGIKFINNPRKAKTNWTKEELDKLKDLISTTSVEDFAKIIDRSEHSVRAKARELGLEIKRNDKRWPEEDKKVLIELSKTMTLDQVSHKLNRSSVSVRMQANKLGIKIETNYSDILWTEEETAQLKYLIPTHTTLEIATIMNKTEDAVYQKAYKLGLNVKGKSRKWTIEDEETLKSMWGGYSIEFIAKKLNRTSSAITNRAYVLNLGSVITNNSDGLTIQEISDLFAVDRSTIGVTWVSLGLVFTKKKVSTSRSYSMVTIDDLYSFLEQYQNIFDSRMLEKNILPPEPEWLIEKRKRDSLLPVLIPKTEAITKQQLIAARKYYLELAEEQEENIIIDQPAENQLVKRFEP